MYVANIKRPKPKAGLSAHAKMQSKSLQDCRNASSNRYGDHDSDHDCQPVMNDSRFVQLDNSDSLNIKIVHRSEDEDTEAAVLADDFREIHVSFGCVPTSPTGSAVPTSKSTFTIEARLTFLWLFAHSQVETQRRFFPLWKSPVYYRFLALPIEV